MHDSSINFERLGPYEIGRKLGSGGMGTVYAATEISSGRAAAVKVLAPALATQPGFRERFEAEIESLKKLEHPHIVQLYGYGQQDTHLFFSMELVEGANLEDELVQGHRFEWREVCQIGIKLCRALKLAHDHGVIHRDIKPANVLWTDDGEIKLSDFGVARLFGNTGLTSEGGVLGTADYMAPEQADGSRVTHHCDLYSLGGVMYALLSGRPPFRSKSMLEMLQLQRYATPEKIRRYAPETPQEFERIIAQLLEKKPQDRFPNALMLGRALEAMRRALTLKEQPLANEVDEGKTLDDPSSDSGFNGSSGSSPVKNIGLTVDSIEPETAWQPSPDDSDAEDYEASPPRDHFITVEDERQMARELERKATPIISLPTLFLVISLLSVGFLIWFLIKPPTSENLYMKIDAVARLGDDDRLREVETEINRYLFEFPNGEHAERVRGYGKRLSDLRMASRPLSQAQAIYQRHPNSIVARQYLRAIEQIELDPEVALVQLQNLITLYDDPNERRHSVRDPVVAAKGQVKPLEQRVEKLRREHLQELRAQLRRAKGLNKRAPKRAPKRAKAIYKAIIENYADKPWAADLVGQAQAALTPPISTPPISTPTP